MEFFQIVFCDYHLFFLVLQDLSCRLSADLTEFSLQITHTCLFGANPR